MNPENGGMPPRFSAGMRNTNASSGLAAASPPSRRSDDAPGLPFDQTDHQEQRGLHEDVVGHVVDGARPCRACCDSAIPKIM